MRVVLLIGLLMIAKAIRPEITEEPGSMPVVVLTILYALVQDLYSFA